MPGLQDKPRGADPDEKDSSNDVDMRDHSPRRYALAEWRDAPPKIPTVKVGRGRRRRYVGG
jgi:hypothetical protein